MKPSEVVGLTAGQKAMFKRIEESKRSLNRGELLEFAMREMNSLDEPVTKAYREALVEFLKLANAVIQYNGFPGWPVWSGELPGEQACIQVKIERGGEVRLEGGFLRSGGMKFEFMFD